MTSSDKSKRKGSVDRVDKTKSQFYVDLPESNTSEDSQNTQVIVSPEKNTNGTVSPSQNTDNTSDLVQNGDAPHSTPNTPKVPVQKSLNVLHNRPMPKEGRKLAVKPCVTPKPIQLKRQNIPPGYPKGGTPRSRNKGHTKLGVLVFPDSLCDSLLYQERGNPCREYFSDSNSTTMGSSQCKDSVEEDYSQNPPAISAAVYGQYGNVVAQLCDRLYTGSILPNVYHSCSPPHNTSSPAIPMKNKQYNSINSDNISTSDVSSYASAEETVFLSSEIFPNIEEVGKGVEEVIGKEDDRTVFAESDETSSNSHALVRQTTNLVNRVFDKEYDNDASSTQETNYLSLCVTASPNSSHNNSSGEVFLNESAPDVIIESADLCKNVSNNTLGAENTLHIMKHVDVNCVPSNNTNVCDLEALILPNALSKPSPCSMSSVLYDTNQNKSSISPELTPQASPSLDSVEKRDKKTFLIAQEVMTSERVFVDVLKLLNVDFRNYVLENMGANIIRTSNHVPQIPSSNNDNYNTTKMTKTLLHEDDLNRILNYLPQLQNLNEEILKDLEERITNWERHKKISDVIVKKGPFLKLYSAYIKEFQTQCDLLEDFCHKYPHFAKVVKDFELSERCAKLSLKHYMLKPVQRIPQYRLLLEDYLKKLPNESADFVDTQTALAVVSNVAAHANDAMKQGTNFMKLLALQDRLTRTQHTSSVGDNNQPSTATSTYSSYELVRPGRYLLKEGELLKLCRRGMQPRYYILFSDVLLYTNFVTSGPGGALRLNYELPLEGMKVETPKAEDFKNEFSVISTSRSFTLQSSSAEERDAWIQALREAIEDNASRRSTFLQAKIPSFPQPATSTLGKQAPVWIPDYRVTMCQICTAEFTLTFRRHHCRACGKVVCEHCSANRAPLQYKRNQSVRVCDRCFEVLQRDFESKYEGSVVVEDSQDAKVRRVASLKAQFKRGDRDNKSHRKRRVPERLEVEASDATSQMSGYLRVMVRRSLRRGWFVLKDRVLYEYRAPQDVCALHSLPVLGYEVETVRDVSDGLDIFMAFQLKHPNQPPIIFHADSPHLAEKWIQAMKEAVVLS